MLVRHTRLLDCACLVVRDSIQVRGAAPVVSYEVPVNAATSGGATVTISGLSFGVYGFTPTGHAVADVDCGTTSWSSATTAQCLLSTPTTLSTSYSKVTVGAVVGTKASSVFTFDGMCRAFAVGSGVKLPAWPSRDVLVQHLWSAPRLRRTRFALGPEQSRSAG